MKADDFTDVAQANRTHNCEIRIYLLSSDFYLKLIYFHCCILCFSDEEVDSFSLFFFVNGWRQTCSDCWNLFCNDVDLFICECLNAWDVVLGKKQCVPLGF